MTGISPCPGVRIPPSPPFLSLAGLALLLAACAQRTLRVETVPPGAAVTIDGVGVGDSPVEVPFTYYGTREVEARLRGYSPTREIVELEAPLWSRFPLDLVLEGLWPFPRHDVRAVQVRLKPARPLPSKADAEAALARARALRAWAPDRPLPPSAPR